MIGISFVSFILGFSLACTCESLQDLEEPGPHFTTIFQEGHEGPETQNDWRNPPLALALAFNRLFDENTSVPN